MSAGTLYSAQYQEHFLAHCLRDSEFLAKVADDLEPTFFSNELAQRILRVVLDFHTREHSAPGGMVADVLDELTAKGLVNEKLSTQLKVYAEALLQTELQNRNYLLQRFQDFLKQRLLVASLMKAAQAAQQGEVEKADQTILEYVRHRPKSLKMQREGGVFERDPASRQQRRQRADEKQLWTLIKPLDRAGVSLGPGHVGVWFSQQTSGGKSLALMHCAKASVFQGHKTLVFIVGEMTREDFEDRLDRSIAGLTKPELELMDDKLQKRIRNMFRFGGDLYTEYVSMDTYTVDDLRQIKAEIENTKGFVAKTVILDYMDNLVPAYADRSNLFQAGDEISKSIQQWAKEEQLYLWTATQGKTEAAETTVADVHHMGGSRGKGAQADVAISLNRTPEEAQKNIIRGFIAKARHGAAKFPIQWKTDFDRMQFYRGEWHEDNEWLENADAKTKTGGKKGGRSKG